MLKYTIMDYSIVKLSQKHSHALSFLKKGIFKIEKGKLRQKLLKNPQILPYNGIFLSRGA